MKLQIKRARRYNGPNLYSSEPVVVTDLACEGLLTVDEARLAIRRLHTRYPYAAWVADDAKDGQNLNYPLGLLSQFSASWALGALNEVRGYLHSAGAIKKGNGVSIWLGFHNAELSLKALQLALKGLMIAAEEDPPETMLATELASFFQGCRQHHPDFQARMLMVGARQRGIPVMPFLPGTKFWQFGWGAHSRVFMESSSNADGHLGCLWQKNKAMTKTMMTALGMPTPAHVMVSHEHEIEAAAGKVGWPCVIKPLDGGSGRGVTAGLSDMPSMRMAFAHARQYSSGPLMVEQHVQGMDHRLMVIHGELVAAIKREPSFVLGDGKKTMAEHLSDLNANRSSNIVKSRYLRPIAHDEVLQHHLSTQSVNMSDVLKKGQLVTLRSNANLSTGGICTDVSAQVNPQVRAMAEQLALASGLATMGLDYLTTDIAASPAEVDGVFIEMNSTPGLDVCIAAGWSEASIALKVLGDGLGHIPVDLTVRSESALKDRTLNPVHAEILADGEACVCGDVLRIGNATLHNHLDEPWAAIKMALRNRLLQRLHVICSGLEIQRHGLPVGRFDSVRVQDPDLPQQWSRLLEKNCRNLKVDRAKSPE